MTLEELHEEWKKEIIVCPDGTRMSLYNLRFLMEGGVISNITFHYILGMHYGYNECCVLNFCELINKKFPPAAYMEYVHGHPHDSKHVLCDKCYKKYKEEHPDTPRTGHLQMSKEEFFKMFGRRFPLMAA